MSTRRARIKAVAALPPRRKNVENADVKNKQKENIEKALKSPRTPRSPRPQVDKNEVTSSPVRAIRTPPALLPISSLSKTPVPDKVQSPAPASTSKDSDKAPSTPTSEKVSVIATKPSISNVIPRIVNADVRPATPKITTATDKTQQSGASNQDNEKVVSTDTPNRTHNDVPDDYSVPSVPESMTDETVMDGIVPLQAASKAPKPIDLLKNEIISDCAEVSFDPIVPLPSPSKVRPKLRPVPRLAPHRRNSIQGSASESEDESRRALLSGGTSTPAPPRQRHDSHSLHTITQAPNKEINRVRNDSISSSVSQVPTQPPTASSPVKEKHYATKARRNEMTRRSWNRRKEIKRDALTMYDLIFYNPTTNPIVPDEDEISAKEANAKEETERQSKAQESEEDADDPPSEAAPVPQIKLGPNGEIILDEQSLVIKQSDTRVVSSVVREGSWGSGGGKYTRAARTADWSAAETVRFYRALGAVGTDFTLMAQLFPDRKRKDLYLKFKKEERLNGAQVDKALRSATAWDPEHLLNEFNKEREEATKKAEEERQSILKKKEEERERMKALKELRVRCSKGAKALESRADHRVHQSVLTADEFIERELEERRQAAATKERRQAAATKRKRKEPEFILPTFKPPPSSQPLPVPRPPPPPSPQYATLSFTNNNQVSTPTPTEPDMATVSPIVTQPALPKPVNVNEVYGVPSNIETGSLVVLRVNDPSSPSKTMLQTYIAHGAGKLTPVSLPPTFLNSVVGYMKKGTPKSTVSSNSSPQVPSPGSADSRSCTPGVIQLNPSPNKRQRHSSYTITPL